ncbi:hypothetical protein [Runella sp.]|uniref:hypothetical protein n=1 Tax=Runella sp. TaxID=1960881 RepID=UPI003D0D888F
MAEIDGLRQLPLDLPQGSEAYLDSGFTDYLLEEDLKIADDIQLYVAGKSNSRRPHPPWINFLIKHHRKPIETTFSEITNLFLRKIHTVTQKGFLLKVALTLFTFTLVESINWQLRLIKHSPNRFFIHFLNGFIIVTCSNILSRC